jgi:integrase
MNNPRFKVNTSVVLKRTARFKDENDKYPVKLQVSFERKQKFFNIKGERYTPKEFEDIMNPKSKNGKKVKREYLNSVRKHAEEIIKGLEEFSFEEFEKEFLGKKGKDATIQVYFEQKALELDKLNKFSSAVLYRATIKSLETFDSKVSFGKITPNYLKNYERWMVSEEIGKTYTSVGMYMRSLKHIINRAIKDNIKIKYPFGTDKALYQIPQSDNKKKAISISEIQKLVTYKPETQQELNALSYWLFSYLCAGMNMVDIANLKFKNISGNSIKFIRQKTRDTTKIKKELNIHLLPEAFSVIDLLGNKDKNPENYIFPIFTEGMTELEKRKRIKQHIKNTNKYMKRIASKVEIDANITTYYARHSYSTVLKRSGASIEFIRESLGHQTTKVTQNYLDSFEDEQKAKISANLLDFSEMNKSIK